MSNEAPKQATINLEIIGWGWADFLVPDAYERFGSLDMGVAEDGTFCWAPIDPTTRRLGGRAIGGRGSGKTVYTAWQTLLDTIAGVGSIVIDPMGAVSNYLLTNMAVFDRQLRDDPGYQRLIPRAKYVPFGGMDVKGETYVVPTPFLFDRGNDSLQDQTARVVDMWKRLSPEQENAPIQGMPAIERTANHAGMLLAAMGNQLVPDAANMLRDPASWMSRIDEVLAQYPYELADPAGTLRLYADPKFRQSDKRAETLSFLNKISGGVLNKRVAAQYGAASWGVDLTRVEQGDVILFDCSGLKQPEKRVAVTWLFGCCMEYFRSRGQRRDVINFVVDELSYLAPSDNAFLEDDFEDLIARISRNYGVSCFFTYQDVLQPSERMQMILSLLGYTLYGSTNNPDAALVQVRALDQFNPDWIRDTHKSFSPAIGTQYRDVYFTPDEQERMHADRHRQRKSGVFALQQVFEEGGEANYCGEIRLKSILDVQHWPEEQFTGFVKQTLVKLRGRTVDAIMAEIQARQPAAVEVVKRTTGRPKKEPALQEALPEFPPRKAGPPPQRPLT